MTKPEAERFLRKHARHGHEIIWSTAGPSHGDPGGYPYISRSCACVKHDTYSMLSYNDNQCNCGADEHNKMVDEALGVLTKTPALQGRESYD